MLLAPWFKIYDLLEIAFARVSTADAEHGKNFRALVNHFFENNGYAFKLSSNNLVEHRGDESFESALSAAQTVLAEANLTTAASEIRKALEDLSKRPSPDLTGAVQHSMAGLECAAKGVAGETKLELGKLIKKHPHLFPPPIGEVVTQLYGYASNNGRHLIEGGEPGIAEAELIVGIAATAASYLARKQI